MVSVLFLNSLSIQEHNALPMIKAASGHDVTSLFAIYAGDDYNVPDHTHSGDWETKRCLSKVWAHRTCLATGVDFDASNTIMIDNEAAKVVDCRDNAIMLNACTAASLQPPKQDDSLGRLADYIEELANSCQIDVRNYLRKYPYGKPKVPDAIKPLSFWALADATQEDVLVSSVKALTVQD